MINININNDIFNNSNNDIINNININIRKLEKLKIFLNTRSLYKNIYNHSDDIILKSFCYMISNNESFWIILTQKLDFYNVSKKFNGKIEYSDREHYIFNEDIDNHFTQMIEHYENIYQLSNLNINT